MTGDRESRWDRLGEAFDELHTMSLADRAARLGEIAADDPDLAAELQDLLDEDEADRPLAIEGLLMEDGLGEDHPSLGREVGPYRLVELLGRGGMGEVFLADRIDGTFEQQVALKLVRTAFDDPRARARFLAERQILARLQHSNVARLLDGGVTDDGAPYLAMELVQGETITDHCDRLELSVRDRLELMIQVCEAVHAAHRMLVVHRDLKPSNIMIADDGTVKLLDFGIAKMLHPAGPDDAPLTQTGMYVLTPEFASPEQVTGEPIGTSSDVYALGLVAYQVLTGLSGQPIRDRTPTGIQRAVCDDSPQAPSRAVLEDPDGAAVERARRRGGLSPARLSRRLAGDLDVILEKALRKEPDRRYLSAEDLAADIRRHLQKIPVSARGDRFGYRAIRFFNRHRTAVLTASTVFLALAVSLALSLVSLQAARRSEARALAEAESSRRLVDFVVGLFGASDPTAARGEKVTARSLLDQGARAIEEDLGAQPELVGDMLLAIGGAYDKLGFSAEALPFLERATRLQAESGDGLGHSESLRALARAQLNSGDYETAVANARRAVEIIKTADQVSPERAADAYSDLGSTLFVLRRSDEAVEFLERAVQLRRSSPKPDARRLAMDLDYLGNSIFDGGDIDGGLTLLREAVDLLERTGAEPWQIADNTTRLGLRLMASDRLDEAGTALDRSLGLAREAADGGHHPEVQDALLARATLAERRGRLNDAASDLAAALVESEAIWGEEHPKTAMILLRRGKVLLATEDFDGALTDLRRGRQTLVARTARHHSHLDAFDLPLAQALALRGRTSEAVEILRRIASHQGSRCAEQAQQLLADLES